MFIHVPVGALYPLVYPYISGVYEVSIWRIYIIGVGLALLVSTDRAILRASRSEASDSAGLHAFFMSLL